MPFYGDQLQKLANFLKSPKIKVLMNFSQKIKYYEMKKRDGRWIRKKDEKVLAFKDMKEKQGRKADCITYNNLQGIIWTKYNEVQMIYLSIFKGLVPGPSTPTHGRYQVPQMFKSVKCFYPPSPCILLDHV